MGMRQRAITAGLAAYLWQRQRRSGMQNPFFSKSFPCSTGSKAEQTIHPAAGEKRQTRSVLAERMTRLSNAVALKLFRVKALMEP